MSGFEVISTDSELPVVQSAGTLPAIQPGTRLDGGSVIGEGAFGEVLSVTVAGAGRQVPLALKRLTPGMADTNRVAELIRNLHVRLAGRPRGDWLGAAVALPYWSGKVRKPGGPAFHALVAADLRSMGYTSLECVIEDGSAALLSLEVAERSDLARSFAEIAAVFEEIGFLHADINPPNVFLHSVARKVAVIDVDGGALAGVGDGVPTACGKSDAFLPPELANPLSGAAVSEATERWSYGITLVYLLLGTHPLFFLRNLGAKVVAEYLASSSWPDIDLASDLIHEENVADYPAWRADVDQLPGEVIELVRALLRGYVDPGERPSAWAWTLALQPGPPWFEEVSVSPCAFTGGGVTVTWWAPHAAMVTVGSETGLASRGSVQLPVRVSGPIRLSASNTYGTVEAWTDPVAVLRSPPRPPGLRFGARRLSDLPTLRLPTLPALPSCPRPSLRCGATWPAGPH